MAAGAGSISANTTTKVKCFIIGAGVIAGLPLFQTDFIAHKESEIMVADAVAGPPLFNAIFSTQI